jgi:hypothetical protein
MAAAIFLTCLVWAIPVVGCVVYAKRWQVRAAAADSNRRYIEGSHERNLRHWENKCCEANQHSAEMEKSLVLAQAAVLTLTERATRAERENRDLVCLCDSLEKDRVSDQLKAAQLSQELAYKADQSEATARKLAEQLEHAQETARQETRRAVRNHEAIQSLERQVEKFRAERDKLTKRRDALEKLYHDTAEALIAAEAMRWRETRRAERFYAAAHNIMEELRSPPSPEERAISERTAYRIHFMKLLDPAAPPAPPAVGANGQVCEAAGGPPSETAATPDNAWLFKPPEATCTMVIESVIEPNGAGIPAGTLMQMQQEGPNIVFTKLNPNGSQPQKAP